MHEYSVVESLVNAILESNDLTDRTISRVVVRRGSAFSEDSLIQAFSALTANTPLENVSLDIHSHDHRLACSCGKNHVVHADDLAGHMFVCDSCGKVHEVDEHADLELLEVVSS